ncbi:comEA protein [Neisseria sicca ATCC 29256]|uniref:ComEA protein n=2 Tax=Neisseria sicca TaxID=490 RepID=C6M7I6_NEISI|nr:comEA protein [Neisseria sicca ATCC 29256]
MEYLLMKKFLFAALSLLTASLSLAAVNINTASPSELEALPGIGPAKAKAIVDYRQQHGAFKSVEELKNVKGIGEGIFSKLKAEATVTPAPANPKAKNAVPSPKK